jgi:hypothetical protein
MDPQKVCDCYIQGGPGNRLAIGVVREGKEVIVRALVIDEDHVPSGGEGTLGLGQLDQGNGG